LEAAKRAFPAIYPALDHADLRDCFLSLDRIANRQKLWSRRFGTLSIALVTVALMAASTAHLTQSLPVGRVWSFFAALSGLVGLIIGGFGVLHSSRKQRWLTHRFATERLRQFFFQTQVRLAPHILHGAASGDWAPFSELRAAAFAQLKQMLEVDIEERFQMAVAEGQDGPGPEDIWLLQSVGQPTDAVDGEPARQLTAAYRDLRLNGQRAFAQHKLKEAGQWISPFPADQLRIFRGVFTTALLLAVALHLAVAGLTVSGSSEALGSWLHIAAIWLAIIALAARTLDEGLRPGAEVERYRAYRDSTRNLLRRYDASRTMRDRWGVMAAMEELSYDEMASFLRSNQKATFAM
jgi:hypothetical protein